jgi:hypothetical protein
MIVSRNGTSYNTADGSQQPHEASKERVQRSDREQINRWEDDGPGPRAHANPQGAALPHKPAWSVLSLTNLLEAIRQLRDEPTEAVARQEHERNERGRLAAEQARHDRAAAAADARRDRDRNAWENT